ncbi:unnamed protein product, partial [Owenia fusiformis]
MTSSREYVEAQYHANTLPHHANTMPHSHNKARPDSEIYDNVPPGSGYEFRPSSVTPGQMAGFRQASMSPTRVPNRSTSTPPYRTPQADPTQGLVFENPWTQLETHAEHRQTSRSETRRGNVSMTLPLKPTNNPYQSVNVAQLRSIRSPPPGAQRRVISPPPIVNSHQPSPELASPQPRMGSTVRNAVSPPPVVTHRRVISPPPPVAPKPFSPPPYSGNKMNTWSPNKGGRQQTDTTTETKVTKMERVEKKEWMELKTGSSGYNTIQPQIRSSPGKENVKVQQQNFNVTETQHSKSPKMEKVTLRERSGENGVKGDGKTDHMDFVDGRCSCCPYGYHIDLDFLRYCDDMANGKYLKKLKKIHRDKRKLRKSMEVYLQQQEMKMMDINIGPPPDVVNTSDQQFIQGLQVEDAASNKILDEIDTSIEGTLSSIDILMAAGKGKGGSESESDLASPLSPQYDSRPYPYQRDRRGSSSSMSSVDTFASQSEASTPIPFLHVNSKYANITSENLAATLASLPVSAGTPSGPQLSQASLQSIREQMAFSLQRMRELEEQVKAIPILQVRISVLKEEKRLLMLQLKAKTHNFNVRSVGVGDFKTDRNEMIDSGKITNITSTDHTESHMTRLTSKKTFDYGMSTPRAGERDVISPGFDATSPLSPVSPWGSIDGQMPKSPKPKVAPKPKKMTSVGVGGGKVTDWYLVQPTLPDNATVPGGGWQKITVEAGKKEPVSVHHTTKLTNITLTPKSPEPVRKAAMRSIGIGDESVEEPYLLQPAIAPSHQIEMFQSHNVHIHEKEIHTVMIDQGKGIKALKSPKPFVAPKPVTRSIGTGDSNVFDTGSGVHVHEKELRTVILEQPQHQQKRTRNVGIECKVATRDVGVIFYSDETKPSTRSIAIGVGEYRPPPEPETHTSSSESSTVYTRTIMEEHHHGHRIGGGGQVGLNLPNSDKIRLAIQDVLSKSVKSATTQTNYSSKDFGQTCCAINTVSRGTGGDTIDVEVRPVMKTRSMGLQTKPSMTNRTCSTDIVHTHTSTTNTPSPNPTHKSTNTVTVVKYPAATNTDPKMNHKTATQTDHKVFLHTEQLLNTGVNTEEPKVRNMSTGTDEKKLTDSNFDFEITFSDQSMNTVSMVDDKSTNTLKIKKTDTGVSDDTIQKVDCDMCAAKKRMISVGVDHRISSRQVGVGSSSVNDVVCDKCGQVQTRDRGVGEDTIDSFDVEVQGVVTETIEKDQVSCMLQAGTPTKTAKTVKIAKTEPTTTTTVKEEVVSQDSLRDVVSKIITTTTTTEEITEEEETIEEKTEPVKEGSKTEKSESIVVRSEPEVKTDETQEEITTTVTKVEKSEPQWDSDEGPREMDEDEMDEDTFFMVSGGGGFDSGDSGEEEQDRFIYGGGETTKTGGFLGRKFDDLSNISQIEESPERDIPSFRRTTTSKVEPEQKTSSSFTKTVTTKSEPERDSSFQTRTVTKAMKPERDTSSSSFTTKTVTSRVEPEHDSSFTTRTITTHSEPTEKSSFARTRKIMTEVEPTVETKTITRKTITRIVNGKPVTEEIEFEGDDDGNFLESGASSGGSSFTTRKITSSIPITQKSTTRTITRTVDGETVTEEHTEGDESGERVDGGRQRTRASKIITRDAPTPATQEVMTNKMINRMMGGSPIMKAMTETFDFDDSNTVEEDRIVSEQSITETGKDGKEVTRQRITKILNGKRITEEIITKGNITSKRILSESEASKPFDGMAAMNTGTTSTSEQTTIIANKGSEAFQTQTQEPTMSSLKSVVSKAIGSSSSTSNNNNGNKGGVTTTKTVRTVRLGGSGDDETTETVTEVTTCEDGTSLADNGVKSILKRRDSTDKSAGKKGISFAEGTVGGFELSEEAQKACQVYANYLEDSTNVTTKELNSSLNAIQQEWFKASSHKLSNPSMVEDFLSCFSEYSKSLLDKVVNMADANGNTAIHYAVSHCNFEIVTLLLDTGLCNVNKPNKAGYTAIMLASLAVIQTELQKTVVRHLFEAGDVNARASQAGQTALMLAVSHGRTDTVSLLMQCGADINAKDEDGSTALMCASEHGHAEIVKLLLAHPHCDATLTDNDGSTALSIAMEANHRDIGVLIYAHVNYRSKGSPQTSSSSVNQQHGESVQLSSLSEKHETSSGSSSLGQSGGSSSFGQSS